MYAAGYAIRRMRATRSRGFPGARSVIAAAAIVGAVSVGFAVVAHGGSPRPETTMVVQPGDTLWSIATAHYPSDDVRAKVEDIEHANGLQGPIIEPGETLRLPG